MASRPPVRRLLDLVADDPDVTEMTPPPDGGAGPAGNARLTALIGAAMLPPMLVVFGSGLLFRDMTAVHFASGFVLVPLTALKLGSTGWRVIRYYGVDRGDGGYRAAGPPWWIPRLMGPVLAASGVLVLLSGVVLFAQRTERGPWSTVHSTSAVVLAVTIALHVILRAWRTVRELGAELGRERAPRIPGRTTRHALVAGALLAGIIGGTALTLSTAWPAQPRGEGPHRPPPPAAARV